MKIERATIIPADRYINLNGEGYHECEIDSVIAGRYGNVHAIQWFGHHGHHEHSRGPAVPFDKIEVIEAFAPAWHKARIASIQAGHDDTVLRTEQAANHLAGLKAAQVSTMAELKKITADLANQGKDSPTRAIQEQARDHFNRLLDALPKQIAPLQVQIDRLIEQEQALSVRLEQAHTEAAETSQ